MRRTIIAGVGAVAGAASLVLLLAQAPATAQPRDPTATDIIDALRPRPGQAQPATRGIRPVAPQATPAPATAPPGAVAPDGLRPVAPAAPVAPAGPPPVQQAAPVTPVAPAMPAAQAPSISLNVLFAVNSAELTPQARRVLDELGRALSSADLSPYRFRIEGHTDTTGSAV
ncbi:OmpA family protein, partial [Elioraea sp.]|uniref:OmpA family protein n=1 Tax=Elioraea sp. TaxID=2185103 RepID=UPI003F7233A5